MRILIADDEELTRDGLINNIDWPSFNITYIDPVDDGMHGLHVAKQHLPDIVLTDVRMPRLNGIEMSKKIQEMNPDCAIIFMSGYSDKDYLKSAIHLKAVRYVEKPIELSEIKEAILEASMSIAERKMQKQSLLFAYQENLSKIALMLTRPGFQLKSEENNSILNDSILLKASTVFTTIIIKFHPSSYLLFEDNFSLFIEETDNLIRKNHFQYLYTLKRDTFFIIQLYENYGSSPHIIKKICNDVHDLLHYIPKFFIVAGKTVAGADKAFQSYNSAVVMLQHTFFYDYGDILIYKKHKDEPLCFSFDDFLVEFEIALNNKNIDFAKQKEQDLYHHLRFNHSLMENHVKDLYYKLYTQIQHALFLQKLSNAFEDTNQESLMEQITNCLTLGELHQILLLKLHRFSDLLRETTPEHTTIFLIKDYISKNYMSDSLSIKEISDHIHLSNSYLCTIFKTETGSTLNQYITKYRMEKAKQLLCDPRNRISEISFKVGYSDGSYFGKSFKKIVGISPSEYRERELP